MLGQLARMGAFTFVLNQRDIANCDLLFRTDRSHAHRVVTPNGKAWLSDLTGAYLRLMDYRYLPEVEADTPVGLSRTPSMFTRSWLPGRIRHRVSREPARRQYFRMRPSRSKPSSSEPAAFTFLILSSRMIRMWSSSSLTGIQIPSTSRSAAIDRLSGVSRPNRGDGWAMSPQARHNSRSTYQVSMYAFTLLAGSTLRLPFTPMPSITATLPETDWMCGWIPSMKCLNSERDVSRSLPPSPCHSLASISHYERWHSILFGSKSNANVLIL